MNEVVTYVLFLGAIAIPAYLGLIEPAVEMLQAVYLNQSLLISFPLP